MVYQLSSMGRLGGTLLAVFWCALGAAQAQTLTGGLQGRVEDPSGSVVPGASVTATHQETNTAYETTTNEVGRFVFPSVRLGLYDVAAASSGFSRVIVQDVLVQVGTTASVNLQLEIGPADFEVTVEGAAATADINLVDAELSAVVDERRVLELPLNGRNAVELAAQQAGVYFERAPDGQGDKLFINGQRHRAVNFTLDGIDTQDNMNRSAATMVDQPLLPLAAENVQEFKVVTGLGSAEYSRGGSQISAVTRAGTNDFHGSLFEFHRNTVLNANDFFNNTAGVERPPLIRNQFGGRLGGPIWRDRTFFYVGYQQTRESRSIAVNRLVYTPEARAGIFRFLDDLPNSAAGAAANPDLIRSVDLYSCGGLTAAALGRDCLDGRFGAANPPSPDPFITGEIFDLIPTPNNFAIGDGLNVGGYRFNTPSKTVEHLPSVRLDHRITDKHLFYAALNYVDRDILGDFINGRDSTYPGQEPLGSRVTHTRGLSANLASTLTPTFINEFRFGFLGGENAFRVNQPFATPFTLDLNTISDPYDSFNADEARDNEFFHVRDTVSLIRGRHQLKSGLEWRRRTVDSYNFDQTFPLGQIGFDDNNNPPDFNQGDLSVIGGGELESIDHETARDLMNNLVGAVERITKRFNAVSLESGFVPNAPERRIYRNWEFDWFFEDSWSLRPNLTLDLGVRYEFASVPVETRGLILGPENGFDSIFSVSGAAGLFHPGVLEGEPCSALAALPTAPTSANAVNFIESCVARYVPTGGVNGRPLWNVDKNNFAPVVGLAWDPFGDGKTSIRAGFRISYMQDAFSIIDQNLDDNEGLSATQVCFPSGGQCASNPGGVALLRDLAAAGTTPETPEFELPTSRSILDSPTMDFRTYDPELATPYYNEWNFSVARELIENLALEVRYVGNRGVKLRRVADFNEMNLEAFDPATGQTFLDAYLKAQHNLQCNQGAGAGTRFDDETGAACITPNPLMSTLIAGEPEFLRRSTSLIQTLQFPAPGEFIYRLSQMALSRPSPGESRIPGGTFWGRVLEGRLPANFFQVNPFVASARGMVNDSFSTYHSLQIELRRRFAQGLSLQGNYTFGKALADFDGDENALLNETRPSPIRQKYYTVQQYMPRHQVNVNWFYELPVGAGKAWNPSNRVARALIGGWQVGGLLNFRTGRPLSILSGNGIYIRDLISDQNTVDLAQPMTNGEIEELTGRLDIGGGVYWYDPCLSAYLDRACSSGEAAQGLFLEPPAARLGLLPQTPIYGPQRFLVDLNLLKRFPLAGDADLEFRWEIFNLFNNVNFAQPQNGIYYPTFGQIAQTVTNPRLMQFALKLNF